MTKKNNNTTIDMKLRLKDNFKEESEEELIEERNETKNNNFRGTICTYNNPDDLQYVHQIINIGKKIKLSDYHSKPLMFAAIVPLKTNHKDVIVYIGYSNRINVRLERLENELESKIYIVGITLVKSKKEEKDFHNMLKTYYDYLEENYFMNGKKKKKIYKLEPMLMFMFECHTLKLLEKK
jgi:hypothetical protein